VLHVLDLNGRTEHRHIQAHMGAIHSMATLGSERIATAGADGVLHIRDRRSMALQRSIPISEGKLRALAVAPGGHALAVACGDGTVRVLEAEHMNEVHTFEAHEGGATALAWHPGKPLLCSGGKDGHLRCWSVKDERQALALPVHRSTVYAMGFDPTGTLCATVGRDRAVKLWKASNFDTVQRLDRTCGGHAHSVNAMLWAGGTLITAGDDRAILVWDQNG
jgi:WD40 repeat protein